MEPRQFAVKTVEDLHTFFRGYRPHPPTGWWFRGQADVDWPLLPKAGRPEFFLPDRRDFGRFNHWTNQAVTYLPDLPENEWERLALAQHHGLATCLLDWSFNPLVALYFACSERPEVDGAVYCYDPPAFVKESVLSLEKAVCNGIGFIPRALAARMLNQKSVFTVHIPPNAVLAVSENPGAQGHPNLAKLTVPASLKTEVLRMLDDYGINRVTLFPDLDGLSGHVNWETAKMARRRRENAA